MSAPSTTQPAPANSEYRIRTTDLPESAFVRINHPIVDAHYRYQVKLGDELGFTKTGVHLFRLPPGVTTTPVHWHSNEDEWMYILDGGEGGSILIWEPTQPQDQGEGGGLREEAVKNGDFFGFKAGVERAHSLKAGTKEMVYLVGGSRSTHDVCHYPLERKKLVIDQVDGKVTWKEEDVDTARQ